MTNEKRKMRSRNSRNNEGPKVEKGDSTVTHLQGKKTRRETTHPGKNNLCNQYGEASLKNV